MNLKQFDNLLRNDNKNIIAVKRIDLAIDVIDLCPSSIDYHFYHLPNQVIILVSSLGENICEAQNVECKSNIIYNFKIAVKNIDDIVNWLELCSRSDHLINPWNKIKDKLSCVINIAHKLIDPLKQSIINSMSAIDLYLSIIQEPFTFSLKSKLSYTLSSNNRIYKFLN